jgi:hypothetical protein
MGKNLEIIKLLAEMGADINAFNVKKRIIISNLFYNF